jgi:hypothetical protein
VVILAGFWSAPLDNKSRQAYSDPTKPVKFISEEENYRNFHSGLVQAIAALRESGKRVFVATDVPRFDADPMAFIRNSFIKQRGELASLLSSRAASVDPIAGDNVRTPADTIVERGVREAAAEAGAEVLDLSKNLCTDSHCRFWQNGILLYSDRSHLTAAGAEYALRGQDPISVQN